LEYSINWKILDMTYTLAVKAVIDGTMKIEKVHLGRGVLSTANHSGSIDAVPVTDDWSKRRLLRFVRLQASDDARQPKDDVGSIKLYFFRAGRAQIGTKTVATGFHRKHTIDPTKLVTFTTEEGLFSQSHATGLGPITFGTPKKVPSVGTQDGLPYVSFTFLYRSRELMSEIVPDDWTPGVDSPPPNFDKDLPAIKGKGTIRRLIKSPQGTSSFGLEKRPSLAVRARKWASEVRRAATTVRPPGPPTNDSKIEVIPTPLEAMKDPFVPRNDVEPAASSRQEISEHAEHEQKGP